MQHAEALVVADKGITERAQRPETQPSRLLPSSAQSPLRQFYNQTLEAPLRLLVLPIRTELHLGLGASAGPTRNPGGRRRADRAQKAVSHAAALTVTALRRQKL